MNLYRDGQVATAMNSRELLAQRHIQQRAFNELRIQAAAHFDVAGLPSDPYYAVSMYVASAYPEWGKADLEQAYAGALYAMRARRMQWQYVALLTSAVLVGVGAMGYAIPRPIEGPMWDVILAMVSVSIAAGVLQRMGWDLERNRETEWRRVATELLKEIKKREIA